MNPAPILQGVIAANVYQVRALFQAFAVRSDEPQHGWEARAPYDGVHVMRMASLSSLGDSMRRSSRHIDEPIR